MRVYSIFLAVLGGLVLSPIAPHVVEAAPPWCATDPNDRRCGGDDGDDSEPTPPTTDPTDAGDWMHSNVGDAHGAGYTGQFSHITVIDDFDSGNTITGRLTGSDTLDLTHGQWTTAIAEAVAYGAGGATTLDFNDDNAAFSISNELDVVNLSFGLIARASSASAFLNSTNWDLLGSATEGMLHAVDDGLAIAVQAAGNDDGAAVGDTIKGKVDVLSLNFIEMIDAASDAGKTAPILFVGALQDNSTVDATGAVTTDGQVSIASYSTIAGSLESVRSHYLMVGVEAGGTPTDEFANYGSNCGTVDGTCLYGTSFAAPIVAGYAAIVGQKFATLDANNKLLAAADPGAVTHRLLSTAREDTIIGYNVGIHGQGEACLVCALSPLTPPQ